MEVQSYAKLYCSLIFSLPFLDFPKGMRASSYLAEYLLGVAKHILFQKA